MKLLLYLLILTVISVEAQLDGLTVSTQQGPVSGKLSSPNVRQFLGIPFATAGRWQAPRIPAIRKSIFNAKDFGDSCVQELSPANVEFLKLALGGQGINVTESEDCLTVNIWSPAVRRKQNTAVLVWIYGGGTTYGTSNTATYVGNNLVRDNDDITVVSFNYRLNIFGQPNAPQLISKSASQNFGLLDVDAAVTWIHDNIANFGGDPERIVLFGQSSGAVTADQYAFAHPDDTKVKGIITQSGSALLQTQNTTILDPTPWNSVVAAVGCGNVQLVSNAAQFKCMLKKPFRTLENVVLNTSSTFNRVVDDINVFSDTPARSAAGNFLRVPLMGGTTVNENDIFLLIQELLSTGISTPTISEMLSDVTTLMDFTCLAGVASMDRISNGVPMWRYQYQAIFPDISTRPELRAYHASEIPLVFGTYNQSTTVLATPAEIALSKFMQGAWVAFARNPQEGLLSLGWPMYNPNTTSLAQLGNPANQSGIVLTNGSLVDSACSQTHVLADIGTQLTGLLVQPGANV
ncbi:carboxylesterase [Agrocybe pediades]|nr:carboxylesterase [Agrocybe pediades]